MQKGYTSESPSGYDRILDVTKKITFSESPLGISAMLVCLNVWMKEELILSSYA